MRVCVLVTVAQDSTQKERFASLAIHPVVNVQDHQLTSAKCVPVRPSFMLAPVLTTVQWAIMLGRSLVIDQLSSDKSKRVDPAVLVQSHVILICYTFYITLCELQVL